MNRCPLSRHWIADAEWYHPEGLRTLSRSLKALQPLAFDAESLRREAVRRARRLSIQGVQPKLSAVLDLRNEEFRLVDVGGRYIIKPPHPVFPSLPENEELTMRLAATAGIEAPTMGLLWGSDRALSYVIRRFDRVGKQKIPLEDGAQLAGRTRETKYDYSVERLVPLIEQFCTFPRLDLLRLYRLILFSFLVGNEDLHLKNVSLIRTEGIVRLSPAYDLVNSTLLLGPEAEESALPIGGKRRGLTRRILVDYLGRERFGLPERQIESELRRLSSAVDGWDAIIAESFLPDDLTSGYHEIVTERTGRLFGV